MPNSQISLKQIKKLREETNVGIMDCRKALMESKGDFDKAKKLLEEKRAMRADKKTTRETKAGLVHGYIHQGSEIGALVKLTCETDFVSRTKEFKALAHEVAMQVAAMNPQTVEALLEQEYIREPEKKIKDLVQEVIAKVDENVRIEKFARLAIKND